MKRPERRKREVRREGSREMRWSERRQRKILENRSWGGQPQGGCLSRLERDPLCVCVEKSSYWLGLLFLIFNFFFNLFNIQNAWLFLLNFTSLGWLCPFASLKAAEKAPVGEGDLPLPQPSFSD